MHYIYNISSPLQCSVMSLMCHLPVILSLQLVKAFFRTNRTTCHEGFALVRPLAYHLAMHCNQYPSALHHAVAMLQDLVDKSNTTVSFPP